MNSPTLGVAPYRDEVISPFRKTFSALFAALEYRKEPNPLGFPKVILWRLLLRNLIDVLLFWMLSMNQVFDGVDNHLTRLLFFGSSAVAMLSYPLIFSRGQNAT